MAFRTTGVMSRSIGWSVQGSGNCGGSKAVFDTIVPSGAQASFTEAFKTTFRSGSL